MVEKKKLLIVLPTLPYPLTAGGNQAMYNGIYAIKNDFDVFVIYIDPIHRSFKGIVQTLKTRLENVHFVPFKYNPLKPFFRASIFLRNFFASFLHIDQKDEYYSFDLMPEKFKPISQDYISFINNFIVRNKIDIVQIEMLHCLSLAITLPQRVKKLFVHHELGFIVNEQKIVSCGGYSEYKNANAELAKILEIGLLNKCDSIITLSEIDKQKLMAEGVTIPIYSSFAVVNTDKQLNNPNETGDVLSFVGPSTHSPNIIGVYWFLENCWGKLLQQDDSYRFKIIGKWSDDRKKEILSKYKNVEFVGFVPNLADALNNTIMIVPITVGSGIRMKILEAACLGIPFVSTTVGAEGLPFESGKDCLKGDSSDEFVNAILKLRERSLRMEFAAKASALVKEKYSIEALRKNRLEIYDKVMRENG